MTQFKDTVKTGVSSGIKRDAVIAPAENLKIAKSDKEQIEAAIDAADPDKGAYIYKTVGEPVFNCKAPGRININFLDGKYVIDRNNRNYDTITTALEYFVEQGILTKEKKG